MIFTTYRDCNTYVRCSLGRCKGVYWWLGLVEFIMNVISRAFYIFNGTRLWNERASQESPGLQRTSDNCETIAGYLFLGREYKL